METTKHQLTFCLASMLIVANTNQAHAQVVAERPGFSSGTAIVSSPQFEGGYTYSEYDDTNSHSIGDGILRLPIMDKLELRFANLSFLKVEGLTDEGLANPALEVKTKLLQSDDKNTNLALILGSTVALADSNLVADSAEPAAKFAWATVVLENYAIIGNVNFNLLDVGDTHRWSNTTSANLSRSISSNTTVFIETYATFPIEEAKHAPFYATSGLAFLVTQQLQIDLFGGYELNSSSGNWFVSSGLALAW